MHRKALAAMLLAGCAPEPQVLGELVPPRPLDALAQEAASELAAAPERLSLAGANGLARIGARFEREDWIVASRMRFAARLDDRRPLAAAEAAAFRERWAEVDLDERWRARLRQEDLDVLPDDFPPLAALAACEQAIVRSDPNELLAAWGRAHDWYGHAWIEGERRALALDGFAVTPAGGAEPGWILRDTLGVARRFALRRAGDHDSLMWIEAGGEVFVPAHFGGEDPAHAH